MQLEVKKIFKILLVAHTQKESGQNVRKPQPDPSNVLAGENFSYEQLTGGQKATWISFQVELTI